MHMSQLTRRTQILLDEDRYARLERRAGETNRSIAALVREAIDVVYPERGAERERAFDDFLAGPLADHGGPEDVKRDIVERLDVA